MRRLTAVLAGAGAAMLYAATVLVGGQSAAAATLTEVTGFGANRSAPCILIPGAAAAVCNGQQRQPARSHGLGRLIVAGAVGAWGRKTLSSLRFTRPDRSRAIC